MSIEAVVLLITSLLATLKAYFEWKKAKAEGRRADNTEEMLKHTIESVEIAKGNLCEKTHKDFVTDMREYIEKSAIDTDIAQTIIKEVTEGDGNIKNLMR